MHVLVERILTAIFTLVRVACLMQGLALLASLAAVPAVGQSESDWLQTTVDGLLLAGAILFATGVTLLVAGRMAIRTEEPETSPRRRTWPTALAATLVLAPLLALLRSGDLVLLWQQILGLLEQAGFREELARGGQGSGLVMLPILVALMVPILETIAAFFLVVVPPLLLVPLGARSAGFLRLYSMLAAAQAGLAICSVAVAGTLGTIVALAMTRMEASGDAEVLQAAEVAAQLLGLVDSTARGFALPVLAHLAWLPFLLLTADPRRYFSTGAAARPPA